MQAKQVKLGSVYAVKVSGQVVPVRLVDESPYGGWNGISLLTDRPVRIKTAAKLRYVLADHQIQAILDYLKTAS
ncbi:MAG TPA: hypothetical protein VLH56_19320 [Dissulfurispiraceae bacterium]|nr:hypothetical protein [Dissulfurispiraceae bacterium]